MRQSRVLPFYMSYPMPLFFQEEDTVTRDLEYLQEMYPAEAKKYSKVIAGILDRLDYEGSMLYDEYPDRWQIYRLTQIVVDRLQQTGALGEAEGATALDGGESGTQTAVSAPSREELDHVRAFVQVLLCYEIYRRRHSLPGGVLKF